MKLQAGDTVSIKYKNSMWEYRDRYAFHIPEFNYYEGKVLYEKWFEAGEVGLTTDQPHFPFRRLRMERIVEINGKKSKFSAKSLSTSKDGPERTITIKGSTGSLYQVQIGGSRGPSCSCKGYQFRRSCRHIVEAEKLAA